MEWPTGNAGLFSRARERVHAGAAAGFAGRGSKVQRPLPFANTCMSPTSGTGNRMPCSVRPPHPQAPLPARAPRGPCCTLQAHTKDPHSHTWGNVPPGPCAQSAQPHQPTPTNLSPSPAHRLRRRGKHRDRALTG
eukprot:350597-Chlamydomonas_euryale.AAC.1